MSMTLLTDMAQSYDFCSIYRIGLMKFIRDLYNYREFGCSLLRDMPERDILSGGISDMRIIKEAAGPLGAAASLMCGGI